MTSLARRAAIASVCSALLLGALKAWAAVQTGSVAMLASLADSALDLFASLVTLGGVHWAAQPADERPFLVLDCRVSRDVVAPYQEEIIRVNS